MVGHNNAVPPLDVVSMSMSMAIDDHLAALILSILTALICALWLASWRTKYVRLIEAIPGPKLQPILGHALHLAFSPYEDIFGRMTELIKNDGKDSLARVWIANHAYVAVKKARALQTILSSTHHLTKSDDYEFLHAWLGLGLLTNTGKSWHSRRKLLTPTFHLAILEQFVDIFNQQSNVLVRNLQIHEGKGKVDIYELITNCTLDIICETAMGTHVDAQNQSDSDYVEAIAEMGRIFFMRVTRPWLKPAWLFNLSKWKKIEAHQISILHSFTKKVIKDRQEMLAAERRPTRDEEDNEVMGRKKRLAFLDMLLDASDNNEQSLSLSDIQEEVDTFMFEGHDTTTSAISSTILLLGHHPDVQAKVQEELDCVIGNSTANIGTNELKNLKYLEAVIKESLRLYPSVPIFGRYLEDDIVLDGYRVPAGTNILCHVYLAHRDPEFFPDPERFDPDRFLPENSDAKRHPYGYVPFSAGPRNCIGQKYAMMELKSVLSKIFLRFNVKSEIKMEEIKFFTQPVLRSFNGVIVSLESRQL